MINCPDIFLYNRRAPLLGVHGVLTWICCLYESGWWFCGSQSSRSRSFFMCGCPLLNKLFFFIIIIVGVANALVDPPPRYLCWWQQRCRRRRSLGGVASEEPTKISISIRPDEMFPYKLQRKAEKGPDEMPMTLSSMKSCRLPNDASATERDTQRNPIERPRNTISIPSLTALIKELPYCSHLWAPLLLHR